MARTFRISTVIEDALGASLYSLATSRGGSISGIIEAALIEYMAARPDGTRLPLGPRLPRAPGRPSRLHERALAVREERIRKRTGRPLGRRVRLLDHEAPDGKECPDAG